LGLGASCGARTKKNTEQYRGLGATQSASAGQTRISAPELRAATRSFGGGDLEA